jgi:hypothetical protein
MKKVLWAAAVIMGLATATVADAASPSPQQDGRVVTAVDRANKSFVALSSDGSTNKYATTDRTVFRVGNTPTAWAAVKAGSKVLIVYHLEGQNPVADEVVIGD